MQSVMHTVRYAGGMADVAKHANDAVYRSANREIADKNWFIMVLNVDLGRMIDDDADINEVTDR